MPSNFMEEDNRGVEKDGKELERVMLYDGIPRLRLQSGTVSKSCPSRKSSPTTSSATALDDQGNTDVSEISVFSPLKDKLCQRKRLRAISVKELLNLDSLTRKHWRGISKQAAKDDMWTQK